MFEDHAPMLPRLPGLPPPAPNHHPAYFQYQYPYHSPPNVMPPQLPLAPDSATETKSYPSPGVTMKQSVTQEAFCTPCLISPPDPEKPSQLEYHPGNRIVESLTTADWWLAGFTVLSCRTFRMTHHCQ
jgi:hypothetical protein